MLTPRRLLESDADDRGFTLLELMIVLAIMGIVLVVAGSSLVSLTQTTNRNDAMVADEQAAGTTLAQLSRDIRSAHSLSIPNGASPSDDVILEVNQPGGSQEGVQWIYAPPAAPATVGTLTREVQTNGGWGAGGFVLSRIENSPAVPVFTYYDDGGSVIPPTSPMADFSNCTTRIKVQMEVAPPSGTPTGVAPFQLTDDVALTDQLAVLTAPGNQQCG